MDDQGGAGARGVIWISGYSASGTTKVGRKVEALLERMGAGAVVLRVIARKADG